MKKVLLIVNGPLDNAGVPRIMMDIFDGLKDEYSFDFISYSSGINFYDSDIIRNGGRIFYIGPQRNLSYRKTLIHMMLVRPWRVLSIIRKGNYDVVHSNSGFLAGDDLFLAKMCGVKTRIGHGHGTYKFSNRFIYRIHPSLSLRLLKKYASHRIAVSSIAGKTLFDGLPFDLILNSVDFSKYEQIKREQHEGINLLQIGYFCPNKNQIFSMEICKQLVDTNNSVHLYLIGYDNGEGYLPKIQDYIEENNLENHISILSHDYNKFDLFPIIDYLLVPSHSEGLSVVCLEGQAAGIDCIVSTAVPTDVDMGLLTRLPLESKSDWIDRIISKHSDKSLDKNKMELFSRENFLNNIRKIYNS